MISNETGPVHRPPTYTEHKALEKKVSAMNETLIEHKMRLENGTKVFQKHNARIGVVENKVTPRPLAPLKIIGITLAAMAMALGALWTLSNQLRDRPTMPNVESVIRSHDTTGHPSMRRSIRAVQTEQAKQRVLIQGIKGEQEKQSAKLDRLLERVPSLKRRRR